MALSLIILTFTSLRDEERMGVPQWVVSGEKDIFLIKYVRRKIAYAWPDDE
jgi:hypothetical protein